MTREQAIPALRDPNVVARASRASIVPTVAWFALGVVCLAGFFETGSYYRDFLLPQVGIQAIDESELAFYLWYAFWGSAATLCFARAILRTRLAAGLVSFARAIAARPVFAVGCASLLVLAGAAVVRESVLLGQPVADDESTYLFEAQTLAKGRVLNPAPPMPEFWKEQFIVINAHGWYGKYPLGHPALLALGERLGLRGLIMPLCGLCSVWLTFVVGRRLIGEGRAALGACLLAISPQFVWTHATLLSQPTSTLLMLASIWALLRLQADARLRFAGLAGLFLGLGCVVRPLPGALFVVAALCAHSYEALREPTRQRIACLAKQLAFGALPLAFFGATFLVINWLQSGDALRSGYGEFHSRGYSSSYAAGDVANSVAGAFLRQNFWLFGWTVSFAFVPFCRPVRGAPLLVAMLVAEYAYRVILPKTVVSATGPIYVMEIVPLLALATADGAVRAGDWLARVGLVQARARAWVCALAFAASVVAALSFVPIALQPLATGSALRMRIDALLAERKAEKAIVFANYLVHPDRHLSWAYYPPNPDPDFHDAVIFPRWFEGPRSARAAFTLWRQHFADRRAFVFVDSQKASAFAEIDAKREPTESMELSELAGSLPASGTERGASSTR